MQSKGLITFFLALLVGACIYALSFTFLAKNFEGKAQAHAVQQLKKQKDST